ncbi:MAG: hypothetical protein AAFZ18_27080 [Myxococcota bacterium]
MDDGAKWDRDTVVVVLQAAATFASILIALIALYAALEEAEAVRKQQEAVVWPRLVPSRGVSTTGDAQTVSFEVANKGIGPAVIGDAHLELDGKVVDGWWEAAQLLVEEDSREVPVYASNSSILGNVIAAQENVRLFEVSTKALDELPPRVDEKQVAEMRELYPKLIRALTEAYDARRLKIEICYCSVFEECWSVSNEDRKPKPLDRCTEHERSKI